jgi:Arc/MetJ family transcription regulator
MPIAKVSLSLDHDLVAAARQRVGGRGLSGYVNEALRRRLQRDRLTELLVEMDAEAGPIAPAVLEEVRRAWPDPADAARRPF